MTTGGSAKQLPKMPKARTKKIISRRSIKAIRAEIRKDLPRCPVIEGDSRCHRLAAVYGTTVTRCCPSHRKYDDVYDEAVRSEPKLMADAAARYWEELVKRQEQLRPALQAGLEKIKTLDLDSDGAEKLVDNLSATANELDDVWIDEHQDDLLDQVPVRFLDGTEGRLWQLWPRSQPLAA